MAYSSYIMVKLRIILVWIVLAKCLHCDTSINGTNIDESVVQITDYEPLDESVIQITDYEPLDESTLNPSTTSAADSETLNMDSFVTATTDFEQVEESTMGTSITSSSKFDIHHDDLKMTPAPTSQEIMKAFKDEEKAIVDIINSIMRQILPHVMKGTSSNMSLRCAGAMMKIFGGLRKLKGWTLKILDSIGKPVSGILHGTPYSMANFDQCLNISITSRGEESHKREDEFFHGQYCRIRIEMSKTVLARVQEYKQGKINSSQLGKLREMVDAMPYVPFMKHPMSHFLGLCIPSLCGEEDVTKLLEALPFPGSAVLDRCESNTKLEVDFEKRVVLGIFFLLLLIIFIGSAVDKLVHFLAEENLNVYLKKRCITVAISFSVFSNTEKLFQKIENDTTDCPNWRVLRGLVVGTIFSLIVYHTYLPPFDAFYLQAILLIFLALSSFLSGNSARFILLDVKKGLLQNLNLMTCQSNLSNLENYLNRRYFAVTICLPIVIETLFLSYGFSLTNRVWKSTWKTDKKKINVFYILISNYIRLCLPLLLCIGIIILLPLVGSGPFWNDVFGNTFENCQNYWWRHLAIFGNFLDQKDQCFPHFWFVSCLLQIIVISTIVTYIISRYRKIGIILIVALVLGCSVAVGILTYNNDFPPTYIVYFTPPNSDGFWQVNYAWPINHAGSFAVGMLLGLYMAKVNSVHMKPIVATLGWIISIAYIVGMCMLIFSYRGKSEVFSPAWSAVFAATHRPLFAMAVGWIFWASAYGYGGFIGRMLSWSLMDPLYKMSYFAYLIHLIVIAFHVGTAREHFRYSHMESALRSLSYICLTYIAAYVCCLIIDLPLKSLRAALKPSNSRQVRITSIHNITRFQQPDKQNDIGHCNAWALENGKSGSK